MLASNALMKLLDFTTDVLMFQLCFAVISSVTCRSRGSCPKVLILFSNLSNSRVAKMKIILQRAKAKIILEMAKMKIILEIAKLKIVLKMAAMKTILNTQMKYH